MYGTSGDSKDRTASGAEVWSGDFTGRLLIRADSSTVALSAAAIEADRTQMNLLRHCAGVVLERVVQSTETPLPAGDDPYAFATIAGSLANHDLPVGDPIDEAISAAAVLRGGGDEGTGATAAGAAGEGSSSAGSGGAGTALARAHPDEDIVDAEIVLPDFPGFDAEDSFTVWVHEQVSTEDLTETAAVLGTSIPKTSRHITTAMVVIHGCPRFAARVDAGEFTMAHVQVVADLCRHVALKHLPCIDAYLARRRADITSDTLRTGLRKLIEGVEPAEDRSATARQRRRVEVETYQDGSACLLITGPVLDIHACFERVQAMARAIHSGQAKSFGLLPGVEIADERGVMNLMYDILTRPQPKLAIRVRSTDPVTGIESTVERPLLDESGELLFAADGSGVPGLLDPSPASAAGTTSTAAGGAASGIGAAAPTGGTAGRGRGEDPGRVVVGGDDGRDSARGGASTAFSATGLPEYETTEYDMVVEMPTSQWWLAGQAAVVGTVPFLTAFGGSSLPGTLADGSPIPPETARVLVGYSSSLTRVLTDPATGTPIDAKALTYRIPASVRRTLINQWETCTAPGCSRGARQSEIDHVTPFFHLDPGKGGLSRFGNLQPLCKQHHSIKTAGRYRISMRSSGALEYAFRHGVRATVCPPDQPIDAAHALEFHALTGLGPPPVVRPGHPVPPELEVLEVIPDEAMVRERDEERQRAEELAAHDRWLVEQIEIGRAAAAQERLDHCRTGWDGSSAAGLSAGPDPAAVPVLPPGSRWRRWHSTQQWASPRERPDIDELLRTAQRTRGGERSQAGGSPVRGEEAPSCSGTARFLRSCSEHDRTRGPDTDDCVNGPANQRDSDQDDSTASGRGDPAASGQGDSAASGRDSGLEYPDHRKVVLPEVVWDHDEDDPPPF